MNSENKNLGKFWRLREEEGMNKGTKGKPGKGPVIKSQDEWT